MSIGPDSDILIMATAPAAAPSVAASAASEMGAIFETRLADLNPLQYVPVVGMIYRAITGEHLDPAWRVGGAVVTGVLMGGPVGIVTSLLGVGLEELFHRVIGDTAAQPDPAAHRQGVAAYAMATSYATVPWDVRGGGG
jgi:hypothetical protein